MEQKILERKGCGDGAREEKKTFRQHLQCLRNDVNGLVEKSMNNDVKETLRPGKKETLHPGKKFSCCMLILLCVTTRLILPLLLQPICSVSKVIF